MKPYLRCPVLTISSADGVWAYFSLDGNGIWVLIGIER